MEKDTMRKAIKAQRAKKKVTIAEVAKRVGKNPTFVAAALNGNHRLSPAEAAKVGKMLNLNKEHRPRGSLPIPLAHNAQAARAPTIRPVPT